MNTIPEITLNNGVQMPQIGLGVYQASDDDTEHAVLAALQAGYRLIDTAALYKNEEGVGRAINASDVDRTDLFVTTKLWNSDQGYDKTIAAFDASLEKLGLDYIDLYLIHWPMPGKDMIKDTWKAMEKLYADKKVRAIGVCNFGVNDLEKLLSYAEVPPVINQIELHPDFEQHEVRTFCDSHNIAVESWAPIGGSGNVGKLLANPVITKIAQEHQKTPAQVAIRWHLQSGLVVIPKSVHEERIRENFDVFDFELSLEDMTDIATLDGDNRQGPNPATMNVS